MKIFISAVLFLTSAFAQSVIPVFLGPTIKFLPPAVDGTGNMVASGSTVDQGSVGSTFNLFAGSTNLASNVTSVGLLRDGSRAVFTDMVNGGEGVGWLDISSRSVRRLTVDTQGCIRPLAVCIDCFFACLATPHATVDGSKLLFAIRRNQPFLVVNSDTTGLTQLPVYSGALAPAPQRVISANGQVVFTSSAPFGPTFAASATDVYSMNLDGTNIRNLTKFTSSTIFSANATISADGTAITFETNYAGAGAPAAQETQIWAVQPDGSGLRALTNGPGAATGPSLSGDGKTGVFVQAGLMNVIHLADGTRTTIAPFHYSVPQSPVISDDGQRVAFLLGPTDASAGAVYEVNVDGSGLHAIYAPRAINPGGIVSAGGFGLPPSPGGLISVYGINFLADDAMVGVGRFPLPLTLGAVSVLANGTQLPMLNVTPWQITAQLLQETPTPSAKIQASFGDGTITPAETVSIQQLAPALFTSLLQRQGALVNQAAAFHAGTAILADDDHPAHAGEVLEMYGTGIGVTNPAVPAGQASPADPVARAKAQLVVRIGGLDTTVLFAGLTPGLAGVAQVNVIVPDGLKPGRYGVALEGGSTASGLLSSIMVQ